MLATLLLAFSLFQTSPQSHSVTLTWVDNANPTGTTYSVYKVNGLCSGSPIFNKIASGIAVKTYIDTGVQPGNYCYHVTATFNSQESAPSNTALAPVPSFSPTNLTVTIQ